MIVVFDLGTSRLKVSAFSITGELLGQVAVSHVNLSAGDRSWQATGDWWQNSCTGFQRLISEFSLDISAIRAFSLSGRGGAGVFLDQAGQVIVEPWLDRRHQDYLIEYRQQHLETAVYASTLIAKYRWLSKHDPEKASKTAKLLYAKDFLLYQLTGKAITDPSSGPDEAGWPEDADLDLLPKAAMPWTIAGAINARAAEALGCRQGIPVAVGAHDGICANVGCGMINDAEFALTLGTHAVCRTFSTANLGPQNRFYCYPPDRHAYGGNTWFAGAAISWALENIAGLPAELNGDALDNFNSRLEDTVIHNHLTFLPYLGGQTIPEKRPKGSGQFHGLSTDTTQAEMLRAVFEGTAVAILRTYQSITAQTGPATEIQLTGGGIVFPGWLQLLANLLQYPLVKTDNAVEGRGAAIFAAVAIDEYRDVDEAINAMCPAGQVIEPDRDFSSYENLIERFSELSRLPVI